MLNSDDDAMIRREHTALMCGLGMLRRDPFAQAEAYERCRGRRAESFAMVLRATQLIGEWLTADERAALAGRLQGDLDNMVSRHDDKLSVGKDEDSDLSHLDEGLRQLLDGDDA